MSNRQIQPDVFHKTTVEDYLDAALETAAWLKIQEVVTEHGKYWKQNSSPATADPTAEGFTERDLYAGAAGVGIFFIELYEATEDEKWLQEAKDAAEFVIASDPGEKWYAALDGLVQKGKLPAPIKGWAQGINRGPIGEAIFVDDLYRLTGEQQYLDFIVKTADLFLKEGTYDEKGLHWTLTSDMAGDGGSIPFFLKVYEDTKDKKYLEAAEGFADYVITTAKQANEGGIWFNVLHIPLGEGFAQYDDDIYPNFLHGTAGIAWALTILYQHDHKDKYLNYAEQAAEFLKNISAGDASGALTPFLYSPSNGPEEDKYYLGWCHGPCGVALLFQALYEATGEKSYKDWAIRYSLGIIRAGAPENLSWGYWSNWNICCGTAGMTEHFISMYELTKDEQFLGYAERAGKVLLSQSTNFKTGLRTWHGNWTRILPDRVAAYSGLYIGASGSAAALLQLYAEKTGKSITPLLEYSFLERGGDHHE